MCYRNLLFAFLVLPMGACANDTTVKSECRRFQFEGGAAIRVRSHAVKTLNARLESGAPRDIISMELDPRVLESPSMVNDAHLSAFFRPLASGTVECRDLTKTTLTRCYMHLPHTSLQVSATFERGNEMDLAAAMREVANEVEKTALSCN